MTPCYSRRSRSQSPANRNRPGGKPVAYTLCCRVQTGSFDVWVVWPNCPLVRNKPTAYGRATLGANPFRRAPSEQMLWLNIGNNEGYGPASWNESQIAEHQSGELFE